ncbi:MAG: hypothetical protein CMM01_19000 [Rhodopirellula sp.]|nr:hypothetical protein [Rhodopirellula sp.]OUX49730.1 MAG: hypothetical protein CBE43_08930 [Rhodopirellula sp. TMED283]
MGEFLLAGKIWIQNIMHHELVLRCFDTISVPEDRNNDSNRICVISCTLRLSEDGLLAQINSLLGLKMSSCMLMVRRKYVS